MKRAQSTRIRYQVEGAGFVQHSGLTSLRQAMKAAKDLRAEGCTGVQVARYDTSDKSDYYEVVEVL